MAQSAKLTSFFSVGRAKPRGVAVPVAGQLAQVEVADVAESSRASVGRLGCDNTDHSLAVSYSVIRIAKPYSDVSLQPRPVETDPPWLIRLGQLIRGLPSTVPIARSTDTNPLIDLANFSIPSDNSQADEDAVWEGINRALDHSMGYGLTAQDLQPFIMSGLYGMDRLFTWFQACAGFLRTNAAVLEPRAHKLCTALEEWYVSLVFIVLRDLLTIVSISGAILVDGDHSELPRRSQADRPTVDGTEESDAAAPPVASIDTSHASTEDNEELIILDAPPSRFHHRAPSEHCQGFLLDIPAGTSPYEVYPFALHNARPLAWNVYATAREIRLFSLTCTDTTTSSSRICSRCQALDRDNNLMGIRARMTTGYKIKSQYSLLPLPQLLERLRQQAAELKSMRLGGLNITRNLATKTSAISDMKRIVMAISKQPISRVHVVLTVAMKKGRGVNGILEQLELARQNLYKPKSYDEAEFHKMALFSRLGGARVAFLAQRSSNLPSSRTTDRHLKVAPLQASPSYPTSQEMELNLSRQFRADDNYSDFMGLTEIPCSVPVDEIKIQERLRWDAKTDMILGTCREHGARNVALEFRSLAVADALLNALTHKKLDGTDVHLAREVRISHFEETLSVVLNCPLLLTRLQ